MKNNYTNLRMKMLEKNLTQSALAELIDIPVSTLSYKLNGRTEFKQTEMLRIAQALDLKADEIDLIFFASAVQRAEQRRA